MNRPHEELVGSSSALASALEHVSNLAGINRPVLIIGERGTGKELAAERLHFLSERWDQQLIKVNCAAISEALLDSELFGFEPGAFTGATRIHKGRFERADGGTLFLDELATMSMRLQEKLLRLIEYGEFERLGGQETHKVDVRIVAATNADLPAHATEGKFREDLLDRLSFDVVHLPPLRFRKDDIAELAHHFAIIMTREMNQDFFAGFTNHALSELTEFDWPGNVRELKNVVERSVYRWKHDNLPVDQIIFDPFDTPYAEPTPKKGALDRPNTKIENTPSLEERPMSFSLQVQTFERGVLQQALQDNQGHQGQTAQALGLSYDQLRGLLKKYQLAGRRTAIKP
jgi:psp operon transcriptional activator